LSEDRFQWGRGVAQGGFFWHRQARVFDAAGGIVGPVAPGAAVIADRPAGLALAQAMAHAALQQPFRIGAEADPEPHGAGMFETLTAGSSGQPRRIRRSQASWAASFAVNADLFGIGPGTSVAVLGRLVHSLSFYGALEGACLGAEVHLLDGLRPDRQRQALLDRRVTVLYATPAQLRLLVEAGGPVLPLLRLVLVGGSKLDTGLRAALDVLAPTVAVREFYGAAETSFVTLSDDDADPASVGRAYPGVTLSVRDPMGIEVSEGKMGEVWVRSPYLFAGYGDQDGPSRWQDGWLSVGEIGHLAQGALVLAGRAGRMVTVADQNVFPEQIEAWLATRPGVDRAAVLPRADAMRGNVLVAVLRGDRTQEAAILRAARSALGPLKAPRAVIWCDDWPVLLSGKTDLAALAHRVGA
jgi:long-chain acyl-CoA synthetase